MRVCRWGNSLAVRLPKKLVDEMNLRPGDEVAIVDASRERPAVEQDERRKRAVANIRARAWTLPENYQFDRDEANQR